MQACVTKIHLYGTRSMATRKRRRKKNENDEANNKSKKKKKKQWKSSQRINKWLLIIDNVRHDFEFAGVRRFV